MADNYSKGNMICGRVCVELVGRLAAPLLSGSGEADTTDSDIILTADKKPMIPGSTLAGGMRSYLRNRGFLTEQINSLFGGEREAWRKGKLPQESERQSRIFIYDTVLGDGQVVTRDGIKLNEYKTTVDQAKFEMQAVERGAQCRIRLEILLREREFNGKTSLSEAWRQDRQCVEAIIAGFNCGELRVGAKKSRGFGKIQLEHAAIEEFDLRDSAEYERWLDWDWDQTEAFSKDKVIDMEALAAGGRQVEHCLKVPLRLCGTILVRKYEETPLHPLKGADGEVLPDSAQLTVGNHGRKAVIPGSTWAGAIRGRIAGVIQTLGGFGTWEKAQKALDSFFGSWYEAGEEKNMPMASGVIFDESVIEGGRALPLYRNAIDRFAGGTVEGALYGIVPWVGGTVNLEIRWPDCPEEKENWEALCGMILWAVHDLRTGMLAVGGETAAGRGVFEGAGDIELDGRKLENEQLYMKAAAMWCARGGNDDYEREI